ncbi:DUF3110 domain-containing protein [Gloeobacter kilaueensis]|uniref:DUF3110 domain-containing protein n=1 Tax=Gloeobacter kilaueensis (strain ATCC BAA-2537 / CCAP 1431/1 / ULC 316 / JS1) TaxID=1183438 RepID=U5QKM3_GLOK1|nr:DUF3110 domain-containing protein [Gloeobacter kilaueensis]AGY59466.1 hypothetical protein GKIL_3220 [Gloeobacter kilaueensis JS1]
MQLWVLIFNAGSENEGIYTLSVQDKNIVVAFESEDDALCYANLLEAQDFMVPQVERIESEEIKQFCEDSDLGLIVVEAGKLMLPPEQSKEAFDWQPGQKSEERAGGELDRMRSMLERLYSKPT